MNIVILIDMNDPTFTKVVSVSDAEAKVLAPHENDLADGVYPHEADGIIGELIGREPIVAKTCISIALV